MMKRHLCLCAFLIVGLSTGCDSGDWEEEPVSGESTESQPEPSQPAEAQPPPTAVGGQTELTKWDLWIGEAPLLRGANIHQRLVYPELDGEDYMGPGPVGPPFTQEDFDKLAALGANWVNVSHPGLYTEEPPYVPNHATVENLDNLLAMIHQADMFAVISFRTGPGRSEFTFYDDAPWFSNDYRNDRVWEDPEAQQAWVDMWRFAAERYRDNPVVVGYDLMVEPNGDYICCGIEAEPDEFYPEHAGAIYDWNVFYPQIVEGIREVDPDTPLIVGCLGMSLPFYLPYLEPIDDDHTVYAVHQYEPVDYTHQAIGPLGGGLSVTYPGELDLNWDHRPDPFDSTTLESILAPVDQFIEMYSLPVTANEFGPIRYEPGASQFLDDQIALFEVRGINHAVWEWGPAWEPLREDQQEFAFRLGTDPKNYTEDMPSDLLDVLQSYWSLNVYRPSNVRFVP